MGDSSSSDEDDAPVAAFRPPDLAQLLQQQVDDDGSDDEEGQPPATESAAAEETTLAHVYSSDSEEPASASPSKKRPRSDTAHAEAAYAADPLLPELHGSAALPPPDLDDVPSLSPPGLDEVPTTTGAAPKRVRQFEHVDGQFATHVYLPVAAGSSLRRDIDSHTACLVAPSRALGERAAVHAIAAAEYHLSLSRTCVLLQPQLAAFTEALRVALRPCRAATAATAAGGCRQLANDSRTRFFAAVELAPQTAGTTTCSTSP